MPKLVITVCLITVVLLGAGLFFLVYQDNTVSDPYMAEPISDNAVTVEREKIKYSSRIGIILDDFGASWKNVDRVLDLPAELGIAVLPGLDRSRDVSIKAAEKGFDIYLHQPMEPRSYPADDPGPFAIYVKHAGDLETINRLLTENIQSLGVKVVGVNNHMGSRATEHFGLMDNFFDVFPRDIVFLDSMTSPRSRAYDVSQSKNIDTLRNNIFLDAIPKRVEVEKAFDRLISMAKKNGSAIGLGHVYYNSMIDVLEKRLPELEDEGVELVRLSTLLPSRSGVQ